MQDERGEATEEALEALGMLQDFTFDVFATVRAVASIDIKAIDLDDAIEKAKAYDLDDDNELDFRYDSNEVDGDYVGFVFGPPDYINHEIELENYNEPFSWDAIKLVKQLAKLDKDNPESTLSDWIANARKLCKLGS
jgi:hypothetical protein